jgi:pimeloyl-ACP methyl ester carboxylesterase
MIPHVIEEGDAGSRELWIAHGILGSASNWRSFARRLAVLVPGWRIVLVDLRGHGESPSGTPPHTVAACSEDLVELARARERSPEILIGHSFGGKVVVLAADRLEPRQTWVLDSVLAEEGPRAVAGDEDVVAVIRVLRTIHQPLPTRDAVRAPLLAAGFSERLAAWTTTNLTRAPDGFRWRFDLDVVEDLLRSYASTDLWSFAEALPTELHLVRAGRSDRWTPSAITRLDAAAARGVTVDLLPDAGHWVHVDAPDALAALLAGGVSRIG